MSVKGEFFSLYSDQEVTVPEEDFQVDFMLLTIDTDKMGEKIVLSVMVIT